MSTRRTIDLPVVSVTLLEDRALVVRRGAVALASGDERVTVSGIAPVAVDKTVSVRVVEGTRVKVVDARIRRRAVVRQLDEATATELRPSLERERDELQRALERKRAERESLERQVTLLDQAAALTLSDLAADAAWGADVAERARVLEELTGEERAVAPRLVELDRELAKLERTLERLDARITALDGPDAAERAELDIDLHGASGASCELRAEYVVPGACWRPWHTARLDGAAKVELTTDGCVWQNTGEDWTGVELCFSTERASLGVEPPRLASDTLKATRKSETLVATVREQEIDTAGLGSGEPARAVAAELPGIDDGGAAITMRATERSTVPSDGRPYRVRLASFSCDAQLELVAFPEIESAVLLKTTLVNRGSSPLLAGPVDLVRSSGLVGRTSVLFIAAGEKFELGWGPESDLRVSRDVERLEEKSRMLSAWVERDTRVRIRLSNLGATARKVSVCERVPVSEIEKVKVEPDVEHTTGRRRPDEHGMIKWSVELAAYGHEQLELRWQLRKHESVVI